MPVPIIIPILITILGISGVAVALIYWRKILDWAENSLFPWVDRNIPTLSQFVKDAFVFLDKVAVAVQRAAKQAWIKLRNLLLKEIVMIRRTSTGKWVRQITSFMIKVLESGKSAPVKIETNEILITWDEIPDDAREELLRSGKREIEIDVTKLRDQELQMVH